MFCIHCGKQIEEGDRFCEFCGGLQEIAPEPEVKLQPGGMTQPVQQPQAAAPVQPQVVYVQQPPLQATVPQPAPGPAPVPAPAPKKKKPPIALFIILGVLLTIGITAAIIITVIVIAVVKGGKVLKEDLSDYGKTQVESYMEENELNPDEFMEGGQNGTGDIGQFGDGGDIGQYGDSGDIGQYGDGGDIGQYGNDSMSWEGLGNPKLEDFNWYYAGEYGYVDGVKWLDSTQYQGKWKGMIIYSADGSEELVNLDLNVNPDTVSLLVDWYMMHIGGNELLPEDDLDDVLLTGYEWGNGIYAEANSVTVEINEFWEIGGTQFGKGVLKIPGADDNVILLVRP